MLVHMLAKQPKHARILSHRLEHKSTITSTNHLSWLLSKRADSRFLMRHFWFVSSEQEKWCLKDLWAARLLSVLISRPGQRTGDDLEIIYDELLHIKALAHLSNTVSRRSCFSLKHQREDGRPGPLGTTLPIRTLQCQTQLHVYVETP